MRHAIRHATRRSIMSNSTGVGLADRVIEGQRYIVEMRTSAGLRRGAAELAEQVDQLGCRDLYPASSHSAAVAAVAVALDQSLRVVSLAQIADEHVDKVVIVEAVAISGLKVRRAVLAVREAGAEWVSALVLKDLNTGEDDPTRFGHVDQLAAAS
jgi:hypothetical protein